MKASRRDRSARWTGTCCLEGSKVSLNRKRMLRIIGTTSQSETWRQSDRGRFTYWLGISSQNVLGCSDFMLALSFVLRRASACFSFAACRPDRFRASREAEREAEQRRELGEAAKVFRCGGFKSFNVISLILLQTEL